MGKTKKDQLDFEHASLVNSVLYGNTSEVYRQLNLVSGVLELIDPDDIIRNLEETMPSKPIQSPWEKVILATVLPILELANEHVLNVPGTRFARDSPQLGDSLLPETQSRPHRESKMDLDGESCITRILCGSQRS